MQFKLKCCINVDIMIDQGLFTWPGHCWVLRMNEGKSSIPRGDRVIWHWTKSLHGSTDCLPFLLEEPWVLSTLNWYWTLYSVRRFPSASSQKTKRHRIIGVLPEEYFVQMNSLEKQISERTARRYSRQPTMMVMNNYSSNIFPKLKAEKTYSEGCVLRWLQKR